MESQKNIDIKENDLLKIDRALLEILLKDNTTGKNIIWATDNYRKHGSLYGADKAITVELITSRNGSIIKPRTEKSKTEQQQRVRQKAEVFTPSWVCNMQNNLVDEEWFGRKDVFTIEKEHSWEPVKGKIKFPDSPGKSWQEYVRSKRLEVSCGEAPYLTSRYDAVTGDFIEVQDRIGILDRKLRIVGEHTKSHAGWIKWARKAVENVYGFEWQGDSLLIARENILFTLAEHYKAKFEEEPGTQDLITFARIIAWNIWQMDGLKFVVPGSCCTEEVVKEDLFERHVVSRPCEGCRTGDNTKHNGVYCIVKDWTINQYYKKRFIDLFEGA